MDFFVEPAPDAPDWLRRELLMELEEFNLPFFTDVTISTDNLRPEFRAAIERDRVLIPRSAYDGESTSGDKDHLN